MMVQCTITTHTSFNVPTNPPSNTSYQAGFDDVQASPADAAPATVEISQEPVIESEQPVNGVSLDQAQSEEFQDAFEAAVAEQLGVDPEDVDVTDVSINEETGAVTVTYQVTGVDELDQIDAQKGAESDEMAEAIASNLQDAG